MNLDIRLKKEKIKETEFMLMKKSINTALLIFSYYYLPDAVFKNKFPFQGKPWAQFIILQLWPGSLKIQKH